MEFQSVDKITLLPTSSQKSQSLCIWPHEVQFLLAWHCDYTVSTCSSYKLRIESMLLKEEFAANMGYLEPSINSMIVAGEG
jgi:hypothetical protein